MALVDQQLSSDSALVLARQKYGSASVQCLIVRTRESNRHKLIDGWAWAINVRFRTCFYSKYITMGMPGTA